MQEVYASDNIQGNGCAFVVPLQLTVGAVGQGVTQIPTLRAHNSSQQFLACTLNTYQVVLGAAGTGLASTGSASMLSQEAILRNEPRQMERR